MRLNKLIIGLCLVVMTFVITSCGKPFRKGINLTPGQVQYESPDPAEELPPDAGDIGRIRDSLKNPQSASEVLDTSYLSLRVRLFPILSTPPQDPYPVTQDYFLVTFYNSKKLKIMDATTKKVLTESVRVEMNSRTKKLKTDKITYALTDVVLVPVDTTVTTTVKWDAGQVKGEYRGDFRLTPTAFKSENLDVANNKLWSVVNYIKVEDYLLSVVPSEMPSYFADEALKSQAVAARTYALFHAWLAREYYKRSWDVDPTTWFQSYRGALVENPARITPAILATQNMVMAYNNSLIEAFFSANSGGYTATVNEAFNGPDRPYIKAVKDAEGIQEKPSGTWYAAITPAGIHTRLKRLDQEGKIDLDELIPGYQGVDDILGVAPYEGGPSGRVLRLELFLTKNRSVILDRDTSRGIRLQFGMKTPLYIANAPDPKTRQQDTVGYGFGHGVGMSQWGARIFADQNMDYTSILKYYYKDINVISLLPTESVVANK